ncbi:colanic acid biosynthesis glycosyltransferase WcaI [Trinickia terrae]|uniref:Colanic acid biosynthesis glycosyltransferase WcaI n=1 Tax=Trinickia terrae TaxID=2571161 RepID=A0A4U1IC66_9BURK|nr:glycosyltransferase WbuB [Trinickia terrae]TKC91169.1 colanic acid biosynthesis glycosyltransferase WcaI [Trinickia terrae]
MKILIYGLNYAPELTGIGKYTAEMAEALALLGHEVRVVCAPPYYPEWRVAPGHSAARYCTEVRRGVRIWRAPLWVPAQPSGATRMVHLASFALSSLPLLLRQALWRPEVVMTIAPALMCAPAAAALARVTGAKSWLHVQDFEVDAAFNLGLLRSERAARIAHAVERALMRRFDVVSSISARMVERAQRLGVETGRLFSLPNWVDTNVIYPLHGANGYRRELEIPDGNRVVLYSGNMGSKQGLELLAAAAARLVERTDLSFVFCGNGATKAELMRRCEGLPNCRFLPVQPAERLNELLNLADIHVLPQRGDAADLVMPSKLTGMLASGGAIIAMARPGTELHAAVEGRGVVVEPENVEALAAAIAALAGDPLRRATLGAAARRYAEETLAPAAVFSRLDARLAELGRGDGGAPRHARPVSTTENRSPR